MGLARAFRASGHEVVVVSPCDGPPPEGVIPVGGAIPLSANGSVAPLSLSPAAAVRTLRALGGGDFDLVHLHEPLCPGPTATTLSFGRWPMVGTFHRAGPSAAYAVFAPVVKRLARRLAVRCAVSPDARSTAASALGGYYELLFNGVETARFARAAPWPTQDPTVLFIGRHEPRKGLEVLLNAMTRLPPEVRLWVAGEGPQTNQLRARARSDERVEWLGRVEDDEAASRLRGADVVCAPSTHGESFGVVLLEAMAAQTPVVASDIPGYRHVAAPGEHALLVPPGDSEALANAVRRVLEDTVLAKELVRLGEARAAEFDMDRLASRYVDIYRHVVARRGRQYDAEPE
jgi:phosphatidylinositol alpha-mannosyltransferase